MVRVQVRGELLRWARERAGLSIDDLERKFPRLEQWEGDEAKPTLKQLEAFAKATHVAIGLLFLQEPPDEPLPIPDFRTMQGHRLEHPSPDLRDMIYACQLRQEWFRDYALATRADVLEFVGSKTIESPVVEVAQEIREKLKFSIAERAACSSWTGALRLFITQADRAGVLVMCSVSVR